MTQQTTVNNDTAGNRNPPAKGWLAVVPYIIAIGVLIAYGFFIHYLLIERSCIGEPDWSQMIYLFSGVEAIVFAAAGFLFGREVNRQRAETCGGRDKELAENQKEEAKKQAVEERQEAVNSGGHVPSRGSSTRYGASAIRGPLWKECPQIQNPLGSIADRARSMFPELND